MEHPDQPSPDGPSESDIPALPDAEDLPQDDLPPQASADVPTPPLPPSSGETSGGEPPDDENALGAKMTFLEHLDELRKRILHSAGAVAVTFIVCWILSEHIFSVLAVPIADVLGGMDKLIFTKPTEPFSIWLKVSLAGAIFMATPYLMVQVWLFIAPGLYRKEKAYAVPFLLSSTSLFLLGGVFAYYVILPTALEFLINQFGAPFTPMVSAIEFFDFEVLILVGMGVVFQLPVLVAFLSLFGMVTPRFLWKNFRYAFLLIVIIAAVVSPTADVINLFLWSGPMVLLYMISIAVSWVFKRRRESREKRERSG